MGLRRAQSSCTIGPTIGGYSSIQIEFSLLQANFANPLATLFPPLFVWQNMQDWNELPRI